jgi:tRNA-modifying protein YgfZ
MSKTTLFDRALIRLAGEDVRGFLQGLVTNHVAGALPVYAGLLTPQGKALFDFIIWVDGEDPSTGSGETLLIDCERDAAADLARRLTLYRLRRPIVIEREEVLCVHWSVTDGPTPDPRDAALGFRWLAPALGEDASTAWRAHRLSRGVPEGRAELGDGTTLWLETNARELNGVSFTKGCYVGQENTARMHHKGKVNRHLAVVDAASEPEAARAWYPDLGKAVVVARD